MKDPSDIFPKRFGLRYEPAQIVLEWLQPSSGKLFHRVMGLSKLKRDSDPEKIVQKLREKNCAYLADDKVTTDQLVSLISKLQRGTQCPPSGAEPERGTDSTKSHADSPLGSVYAQRGNQFLKSLGFGEVPSGGSAAGVSAGAQIESSGGGLIPSSIGEVTSSGLLAAVGSLGDELGAGSPTLGGAKTPQEERSPSGSKAGGGGKEQAAEKHADKDKEFDDLLGNLLGDDEESPYCDSFESEPVSPGLRGSPPRVPCTRRDLIGIEGFDYDNFDLNKLTKQQVDVHKKAMDKSFLQNQLQPGDPDFVFDSRRDFEPPEQVCEWDSD